MRKDIWLKVFCSYTKDRSDVKAWLDEVEALGQERAIEVARKLTEARGRPPDAITLGFSPQVLVGALALLPPGRRLYVITSPEVAAGKGPGALSKRALDLFADQVELLVAPFAPSQEKMPSEVVEALAEALRRVRQAGAEVLDVSGGTQLVPLAAVRAGFRMLTYAYPTGQKLVFYPFEV